MVGTLGMALWLVGAPPGAAARQDPRHPAGVAGEWIDLKHSGAADTAVWVLAPNGDDQTLRLTLGPDGRWAAKRTHYGRWWADGRELCFVHRPGRQGAACIVFSLDTARTAAGTRSRLLLHDYRGEHSVGDRELLARF